VYDLIRGTNPQPGATTSLRGQTLKVYDCEKEVGVRGLLGEVVSLDLRGFDVACEGGAILLKRVRPAGSEKMNAADYARQIELEGGERLGGFGEGQDTLPGALRNIRRSPAQTQGPFPA